MELFITLWISFGFFEIFFLTFFALYCRLNFCLRLVYITFFNYECELMLFACSRAESCQKQ